MTEDTNVVRPWTVKNMPDDLVAEASAFARRNSMSLGQLVTEGLELRMRGGAGGAPSSVSTTELVALASSPAVARWLRSGVAKQLGQRLGIDPPRGPRLVTITASAVECAETRGQPAHDEGSA